MGIILIAEKGEPEKLLFEKIKNRLGVKGKYYRIDERYVYACAVDEDPLKDPLFRAAVLARRALLKRGNYLIAVFFGGRYHAFLAVEENGKKKLEYLELNEETLKKALEEAVGKYPNLVVVAADEGTAARLNEFGIQAAVPQITELEKELEKFKGAGDGILLKLWRNYRALKPKERAVLLGLIGLLLAAFAALPLITGRGEKRPAPPLPPKITAKPKPKEPETPVQKRGKKREKKEAKGEGNPRRLFKVAEVPEGLEVRKGVFYPETSTLVFWIDAGKECPKGALTVEKRGNLKACSVRLRERAVPSLYLYLLKSSPAEFSLIKCYAFYRGVPRFLLGKTVISEVGNGETAAYSILPDRLCKAWRDVGEGRGQGSRNSLSSLPEGQRQSLPDWNGQTPPPPPPFPPDTNGS
jgi:hypothetical protein